MVSEFGDSKQTKPEENNANERKKFYKAPRRFDLSTVFVVTFVCASVFGIMQAWEIPVPAQVGLAGTFLMVGLIQMFASESKARLAAIGTGWLFVVIGIVLAAVFSGNGNVRVPVVRSAFLILTLGTFLGYIAGVMVAGVFLLADYVRIAFRNIFGGKSGDI